MVNICAFDKTGTLTESDLEIFGCKPAKYRAHDKKYGFGHRININNLNQNGYE